MPIRKKAIVIEGRKRMRRVMTAKDIKERDRLNEENTAEALRRRALEESS